MNNLNEINDNINELIMSKSFEHLTEEEKAQALAYAGSEEEYNSLRLTLMAITSSFSEETEEEFAGDDVKTDLMSQFEKKYGSSGNRTKVVPLYRKPYFQLAIAASLALLVFLSVPIFKQSAEENKMELAKAEKADGETAAGKNGNAASGDNMTMGLNKPDVGSEAVPIPEEKSQTTINDLETREKAASPLKQLMDEQQMDRKNVAAGKEALGESINPGSNAQLEKSLKKENATALEDRDVAVAPSVDNLAEQEKLTNEAAANSVTYNKNSQKKDEVLAAETERKRDDNADKAKEKVAATTVYKSHGTDHTKDHAKRMNTMATSGTSGPTSNLSAGAVSFVEQNKNQMMDLLFTVY